MTRGSKAHFSALTGMLAKLSAEARRENAFDEVPRCPGDWEARALSNFVFALSGFGAHLAFKHPDEPDRATFISNVSICIGASPHSASGIRRAFAFESVTCAGCALSPEFSLLSDMLLEPEDDVRLKTSVSAHRRNSG